MAGDKWDLSRSTLNPLFIAEKNPPASTPKSAAPQSVMIEYVPSPWSQAWMVQYVVRFILFLVTPLVVVWYIADSFVQAHLLLLTYAQVTYIILCPGTLLHSFWRQKHNKMLKLMLLWSVLYACACISCKVLPKVTEEALYNEIKSPTKCTCGECEYFFSVDFPGYRYTAMFSQDKEKALGVGTLFEEKRLPQDAIKQAAGLFRYVNSEYKEVDFEICGGMMSELMLGAFFGPCNVNCEASLPHSGTCLKWLNDEVCFNKFQRLSREVSQKPMSNYAKYLDITPVLQNPSDDKLGKSLLKRRVKLVDNALTSFKNASSFCVTPGLFDTDPVPIYNCTKLIRSTSVSESRSTSYSGTAAKVVWSVLIVGYWTATARYAVGFVTISQSYSSADLPQLLFFICFLCILCAFLFQTLSLFDVDEPATLWSEAVSHILGLALVASSFLTWTTLWAFRGKTPKTFKSAPRNILFKLYYMLETGIDIEHGKYYYHYTILCELLELALQTSTIDSMVRTNDLVYVMVSITILSVNLITTPLAFLSSKFSDIWGRKLTYMNDAVLESAFLFLNIAVTRRRDLLHPSVLLSIIFPLLTLLGKITTFVELTTTYLENTSRRRSWVAQTMGEQSSSTKPITFRMGRTIEQMKLRIIVCLSIFTSLSGVIFFVYMMIVAENVMIECSEVLGAEIWAGSYPRFVFKMGLLERPSCHFESINRVLAPHKNIVSMTPGIGQLVNLESLVLPGNNIRFLPRQILKLRKISSIDLQGNPVWTTLVWSSLNITEFPKILSLFTELRVLDLGCNKIHTIPDMVGNMQLLRVLKLQNNSIHRHGLSPRIMNLLQLKHLDIRNNPVATALTWYGVDSSKLLRVLSTGLNATLTDLDVSSSNLQTDDVKDLLRSIPRLVRLNVSKNRLTSLDFGQILREVSLSLLDLSLNPISNIRLEMFHELNYVWKRGTVDLKNIGVKSFTVSDPPYHPFPTALVGHFFQQNVLQNILFYGKRQEIYGFPLCKINDHVKTLIVTYAFDLPTECISRLTHLHMLTLGRNRLESLDVSSLTKLHTLVLWDNALTSINVTSLIELKYLDLGGNALASLDVSRLSKLLSLRLRNNRFNSTVHPSITRLTNVECLSLRDNQFSGNISWVKKLTRLRWLDLRNNSFHGNFPDIRRLKSLEYLGLAGSGLSYNASYITSQIPHLEYKGGFFRTRDFQGGECAIYF